MLLCCCAFSCGSESPLTSDTGADAPLPVDAPQPVDAGPYTFGVSASPGCFIELDGVYVEINGEMLDHASQMFSSFEQASGSAFVIESKYGDVVLDRVVVEPGFCDGVCSSPPWQVESASYTLMEGGRLARESAFCNGCTADGFCSIIDCHPILLWGCADAAAMRCGMLNVHAAPDLSYITCVPDGQVAVGESCIVGPAGLETGYDNCAAGTVCIDGVCRAFCSGSHPCTTGTCNFGRSGFPVNSYRAGYCAP